ncbi:PAS domain-containing sensor histidine kinase [Chitinophaga rhizophila]|uniref:histidine kinase n=1 Tax=Chitinophaga rhizophila TaxID=2866212 RepID=A0ABS7GIM9_9BACT|nr:PAS domain-containing sensor histidine kinase [Chitinophaga rhizophila]MBW8687528.1 PAS domain-containing sensor histidine kinase [Chitinophaga rhizophila]
MKIDHANNWWPAIADAIEEGYFVIDEHDKIVAYNQPALQILHLSPAILNDPACWHSQGMQALAAIASQKEAFSGKEILLEREDDTYTWLRVNGKPIITSLVKGYCITFTEIAYQEDKSGTYTPNITAEELKNLLAEVNRKNIILHATSIDLQQKIKQLREFNSIIAHNLRGPATALMGSTELLQDVREDADRDALLYHMKTSATAILSTLNDLQEMIDLQVSRHSGVVECDLETMVRQVWNLLRPQVVEKNAHLSLNLSVCTINYVKVYLENILFNLIHNAITYTRQGVDPEITVSSWQEDERVVLMVQDNGIGIDLKLHQDQLFRYKQKFHRGYESKGISLFKIRNQVRTLGGDIEVRSEAGIGSSFYVYFNNRVYTLQQDE